MINYPRNVIFIVYFLSSNLFTERFHSTAIISLPILFTEQLQPHHYHPNVCHWKKTPFFTVILLESSEVKPVEDAAIFSPPSTLLPLWRSGHRHWKAWSSWKLKIYPHFLFCPSRVSSVLPSPPPPLDLQKRLLIWQEGGRWPEIVCSSDGSQVLQLT